MLLQLSEIREIQFLLCLTNIILGAQLAIFFFTDIVKSMPKDFN